MTTGKATYDDEYLAYLRDRSRWRQVVRRFYLRDIRGYCLGPTIDFGCGVGELLAMLPEGSAGVEINPAAVAHCRGQGLDVRLYEPEVDAYSLSGFRPGDYGTFTMNHVLEHLDDPGDVVSRLFASCQRLGIRRIVFTVPGRKGYALDKTHRTFVDEAYLRARGLFDHPAYRLRTQKHFPINWRPFDRWFTHNEYRLVFDKRHD